MTKNEFKDKLLKKIEDAIEAENTTNTNLKHHYINTELWCSVAQCEDYIIEANCIKHTIMRIVKDYFDNNEIETDNSPYKEMWEELKKEIERSKSEYEKAEGDQCNTKLYHFATMSKAKKMEDAVILSVMDDIERERGIE